MRDFQHTGLQRDHALLTRPRVNLCHSKASVKVPQSLIICSVPQLPSKALGQQGPLSLSTSSPPFLSLPHPSPSSVPFPLTFSISNPTPPPPHTHICSVLERFWEPLPRGPKLQSLWSIISSLISYSSHRGISPRGLTPPFTTQQVLWMPPRRRTTGIFLSGSFFLPLLLSR